MFGGLHIEIAAWKTPGDWIRASGWVQALVQADIASPVKLTHFYMQHMLHILEEPIKS